MIDVHVLIRENPNPEHLKQCLDSLKNQPITLHLLPGVPGHIGEGRIAGYSAGSSPWCCYVDDDDWVLPDTFSTVLEHLADDIAFVYVQLQPRNFDGSFKPTGADTGPYSASYEFLGEFPVVKRPLSTRTRYSDHLVVYRRDLLSPLLHHYANKPRGGDMHITYMFAGAYGNKGWNYTRIERPFYMWRL